SAIRPPCASDTWPPGGTRCKWTPTTISMIWRVSGRQAPRGQVADAAGGSAPHTQEPVTNPLACPAAALRLRSEQQAQHRMGGSHMVGTAAGAYVVQEGWEQLPPGFTHEDCVGVDVDTQDNVYVLTRGQARVLVYSRDGAFLRAWGEDLFTART